MEQEIVQKTQHAALTKKSLLDVEELKDLWYFCLTFFHEETVVQMFPHVSTAHVDGVYLLMNYQQLALQWTVFRSANTNIFRLNPTLFLVTFEIKL